MFVDGSRRPASSLNGVPAPPKRCSTRIVGVYTHKFPADANPGTATDMYVVGMFGEKNGVSRPAIADVFSQSKRMRIIRKFAMPEVVAVYPLSFAPQKSAGQIPSAR